MRSAPSLSRRWPGGVSDQRTWRPARSAASQPSAAVRASAWRADLSSTPNSPSADTRVWVQTGAPRGRTNSPRMVISRDRALAPPISRRLLTAGRDVPSAMTTRLPGQCRSAGDVHCPQLRYRGPAPGAVPPQRERDRRGDEQAAAGREPGGEVDVLADDGEGGGQPGQRLAELAGVLRAVERAAGSPGDLHQRAVVGEERVAGPAATAEVAAAATAAATASPA